MRWDLGRPQNHQVSSGDDEDGGKVLEEHDDWVEVKQIWAEPKMGRVCRSVADAAAELFGWQEDLFLVLDEKPSLLVERPKDVYL
ncbi:hypothetical protein ACHAQK_012316 [Fusarium lateritium]